MKYTRLLILIFSGFLMFSCGKGKDKKSNKGSSVMSKIKSAGKTVKDVSKATKKAKKMSDSSEDMEKIREKLSETEPASSSEMKDALPEKFFGWDRESFSVKSNPIFQGLKTARAEYVDGDSSISLEILDGAGETASTLVYGRLWSLRSDIDDMSDKGFKKTKQKNGDYMSVSEEKQGDKVNSTIVSGYNDRFLVTLRGKNLSAKELEKAYDELDLSSLE